MNLNSPSESKIYQRWMFNLIWVEDNKSIRSLLDSSILLEEWETIPGSRIHKLSRINEDFWLSCSQLGAIRFDLSYPNIFAFPENGIEHQIFERVLVHEWLPLVYQAWGFQVLHASAALNREHNAVVAFTADTGKGKSTLGYGLGLRPGWQQITDDALTFKISEGDLCLYVIPNAVRLRPDSANYYQQTAYSHDPLSWPEVNPRLEYIFFLEPIPVTNSNNQDRIQIKLLDGAQAYPLLLKQAYAFTLKLPGHNQQLMQNYLKLASQVKCYQLHYTQTFSLLDDVLDNVENQVHKSLSSEERLNN